MNDCVGSWWQPTNEVVVVDGGYARRRGENQNSKKPNIAAHPFLEVFFVVSVGTFGVRFLSFQFSFRFVVGDGYPTAGHPDRLVFGCDDSVVDFFSRRNVPARP